MQAHEARCAATILASLAPHKTCCASATMPYFIISATATTVIKVLQTPFECRANAVKLVGQLLVHLRLAAPACLVASIRGGDKHNAIPREAEAVAYLPPESLAAAEAAVTAARTDLTTSFKPHEPGIVLAADFNTVRLACSRLSRVPSTFVSRLACVASDAC